MDATKLRTLIRHNHFFSTLDTKMQISTVLCLLEIAMADEKGIEVSVNDIGAKMGLQSGTASRNISYWATGTRDMTGAFEYVKIDFHSHDRRLRRLTLTQPVRLSSTKC